MRKEEAEQHLAECAACRRELEETKKIMELCRGMENVPLPEGFSERLHERLMQEAKPKKMPMFRLQQYKRGFAIGAAVVAASMVFVATPFFRLYNESGNVPHIEGEKSIQTESEVTPTAVEPRETPTVTVMETADAETEAVAKPPRAAEPTEAIEEMQTTAEPKQEPQTASPAEQSVTTAEPQAVQKADAAEPSTSTEPSAAAEPNVQTAEIQSEIGVGGAVPFVASRAGGSGGASAAVLSAEPTFAVLEDTAQNRAWVRENAAAYDSRISADGTEIVTLTEEEYQACLYDGPEAAENQELPQTIVALLDADGYYIILK